jgi:hypothetical protein
MHIALTSSLSLMTKPIIHECAGTFLATFVERARAHAMIAGQTGFGPRAIVGGRHLAMNTMVTLESPSPPVRVEALQYDPIVQLLTINRR